MKEKNESRFRVGVVADITLHTSIANRFFRAGWSKNNIGLIQFCSMIAKLYAASRADNPYADWYLMKTYKALTSAIGQVHGLEKQLQPYFNKVEGVSLRYFENKNPWTHELYLSTQFCHLGAELLTRTDQVLRQILTLLRAGIKQQKTVISLSMPLDIMQEAYDTPRLWIGTGVTRKDVMENNQKAQTTKNLYEKELPKEILNKEIEFSFLPKVKQLS
jgi:integrating conjugative element protein (TIGR03761 family)